MIGPSDGEALASAVSIRTVAGAGVARIALVGELDLSGEDSMAEVVRDLLSGGDLRELVIDLAGVSFCDSSGIRILVRAHNASAAAGMAFCVCNVQPAVAEVLRLTGVWSTLTGEARSAGGSATDQQWHPAPVGVDEAPPAPVV